jgi:predicted dehydrogenase
VRAVAAEPTSGATPESAPEALRVAVVGTGALGRHHVRILSELPGAQLVGIHDARPEVASALAEEHGTRAYADLDALAAEVDAVVLAVPTTDHAKLGVQLLERGLHVLVEKPIAASLAEADALIAAADRAGRVLAVGHVEFFNPAVQALLGEGTRPGFVEVQRLGVFSPRSLDVDVILDLMIHDLQILDALDPSGVAEIRATGIAVLSPRIDIANVRLQMASGCVANLTASRVSAERVRKLRVFGPNRYLSLDYPSQELKGYELQDSPDGRRIAPLDLQVVQGEPLRRELEAFLRACRGEATALVDGRQGRRALATALAVLDAASAATLAAGAGSPGSPLPTL